MRGLGRSRDGSQHQIRHHRLFRGRDQTKNKKKRKEQENKTSWGATKTSDVDAVEMASKNDHIGALCANKPLIAREDDGIVVQLEVIKEMFERREEKRREKETWQ